MEDGLSVAPPVSDNLVENIGFGVWDLGFRV